MKRRHVLPRAPRPQRYRMFHPWLTAEASAAFLLAAERRKLHPDVMVARVLEVVARDRLIDAVLDDADEAACRR